MCEHDWEATKWVNSLKAVQANPNGILGDADDYLNVNRYEKVKIYSRITGKSMYKEYDSLLEVYEEEIHEKIEVKLMDHL